MPIPSGDYRIQIELVNDKQTVVATDLGRSFRIQRPETNKVSFSKIDSYQQEYTTQNGDIISNQWTFSKPLESDQRFRLKIVSEQTGNTGVLVTNILPYNNRFDWKVADSARTNQGENQTLALEPGSYRMSIELIDKHGSVLNSDKSPIFTIDEKLLSQKYIKLKAHQS